MSHIGEEYIQSFGDEILQTQTTEQQQQTERNEPPRENETNRNTESTTSNNSEETVVTHERRHIPSNTGPRIQRRTNRKIAVHYVRINRVVEEKAKRNEQQEDNVRSAELDFMLDLETIIKETAADLDLIELNCCIEDNNTDQIPHNYRTVDKKLTHRWGVIMVDDRIVVQIHYDTQP